MEETIQTLIESYSILQTNSPQITQASEVIISLYSQLSTSQCLLYLIENHHNEYFQKSAMVGLQQVIKNNYESVSQSREFIQSILNLTIFEKSDFIRNNAIFYITEYFASEENLQQIFSFINNSANENNFIMKDSSLKLLRGLLNKINEEIVTANVELFCNLISYSYQSDQINLKTDALLLFLEFAPFLNGTNDVYKQFVKPTLDIFVEILNSCSLNHIDKICRGFSKFINESSYSIDYDIYDPNEMDYFIDDADNFDSISNIFEIDDIKKLFLLLLEILKSSVDLNIKNNAFELSNAIFSSLVNNNLNEEFILNTLHSYSTYVSQFYRPGEYFDLSTQSYFSEIMTSIMNDQVFELILSYILQINEPNYFIIIQILYSSFQNAVNIYSHHISVIIQILNNGLKNPDLCIRIMSSIAILEFINYYNNIDITSLIQSLIEAISNDQVVEYFITLDGIIKLLKDDEILNHICAFIFEMLNKVNLSIQQQIIYCLSSLTKQMQNISIYFDNIFNLMHSIIINCNDETMQGTAVSCISNLCKSCKNQISQYIPEILNFVYNNINSFISYECINLLGIICDVFPETNISNEILSILLNKANELDFDSIFDETNEFEIKDVAIASASLRVFCQIISLNPDLLVREFETIFQLLVKYKDSPTGDQTLACARSLVFISKSLRNIQIKTKSEIIKYILPFTTSIIKNSSDFETAENAFIGCSNIIDNFPPGFEKEQIIIFEQQIYECINLALTGGLFFQRSVLKFNENFFNGIYQVLNSLKANQSLKDVYNKISPILQELSNNQNANIQKFVQSLI